MKTLLCCLGLLAAMCLPGLHAEEIARTCGVRRAAVEAYLQAHIANVSLVENRVVLCGDGVNTVLTLVKAGAGRVELRYPVLDSLRGGLQIDEGAVYLAVSRACAGA